MLLEHTRDTTVHKFRLELFFTLMLVNCLLFVIHFLNIQKYLHSVHTKFHIHICNMVTYNTSTGQSPPSVSKIELFKKRESMAVWFSLQDTLLKMTDCGCLLFQHYGNI